MSTVPDYDGLGPPAAHRPLDPFGLTDPLTGRPLSLTAVVRLSASSPHGPLDVSSVRSLLNPAKAHGVTLRTALAFQDAMRSAGWTGDLRELVPGRPRPAQATPLNESLTPTLE